MKNVIKVIYMLAIASLAACGHKDDAPVVQTTAAVDTSNNFQSGECGSHVVSDYRDLGQHCRRPRSREEAHDCRTLAQSFLSKYPSVNCTTNDRDERSGEVRARRIDVREIEEILERLRRVGT